MFESPADLLAGTGYHSGTLRPCAVSLTLRYSSHVGQDFASSPSRYVQNFRLAIVSSPGFSALISGVRIQKRPLTHPDLVFPDSASSLLLLTGKGLTPLSSLSFSWSAFFGRTPEVVFSRLIGVATVRLPTPACVIRTCRAFHPIGHVWLWSESRRGICNAPCSLLTRFESNGSADFHVRVFPARPHSRRV